MSKSFSRLIKVARSWLEFTRDEGTGIKYHCDEFVKRYHAYDSDHTQAAFGLYPHEIEIAFHRPEKIAGTAAAHDNIDEYTIKAEALLRAAKEAKAKRTEAEEIRLRTARIEKLQSELRELGVEPALVVGEVANA